jgi:signal transduction histidine kinase
MNTEIVAAAKPAPGGEAEPPPATGQSLRDDIAWLVRLRWLAVLGVFGALLAGWCIDWEPSFWQPTVVAVALAAANLTIWWQCRRQRGTSDPDTLQWRMLVQLVIDLVALSFLIEWTGGIANPFVMFFVFPVAIGAITLKTHLALALGTVAFTLFAGLVGCAIFHEAARLPLDQGPSRLGDLLEHPAYIIALLTAAGMTLFGIVYFVRTVVARHELAEEQRRHHARIAVSRERMARVGMIAAGVAHSVRNPLHGVLNCIDLVRDGKDKQEVDATLELMEEGLSRIEQVTARLLSLSRESPLGPLAIDLDALVRDTLRLLEVRAARLGIEFRPTFGGIRDFPVDPTRIQETLFNILDNAMAAVADRPERWVAVRTSRIDEPFAGICLEVEDPGIGVEAPLLDKVFDPFFSTKPVGEGTGLGLAIAKEVVEAHGGVIQFLSKPNSGTRVRILLPDRVPAPTDGGTP